MTDQKRRIDDEAHVYCSVRQRIVDVERCLACRRLVDHDLDARPPFVVCRGPEDAQPAAS